MKLAASLALAAGFMAVALAAPAAAQTGAVIEGVTGAETGPETGPETGAETAPETRAGSGEAGSAAGTFALAPTAPPPVMLALSAPSQPAAQPGSQASAQANAPAARPFAMQKPVFDETWATLGLGLGFVPSYSGSDDYQAFPLPLIAGRVGGIGISPNGPGFVLDLFSPAPSFGPRKTTFSAGPALRVRADRVQQIGDEVVETLEDLDLAVELGGNVGVAFPGVFNPRDTLTLGTQVRFDVAGAHDGVVIEPQIGYRRSFGTGIVLQTQISLQFVDDSFADYYFTVTPAQSAQSGLPAFDAEGGINSAGSLTILNFDLDGNLLNGGLSIYTVLGYTRLVGDAQRTPFTDLRGDPNQFLGGVGLGYTF